MKTITRLIALFIIFFSFPFVSHAGYMASDVIGQSGFTATVQASNASGLKSPLGVAIDKIHHRLFVVDSGNHRVLVHNLDSQNNLIDKVADYVLGQNNFSSSTLNGGGVVSATGLKSPYAVLYESESDSLFVTDTNNNRVVVYDFSSGITDGMAASHVLGQVSLTATSSCALTATSTCAPIAMAYDESEKILFVTISGSSHNRVLVYDLSGGITDGMAASYVLGQPNLTTALTPAINATSSSPFAIAYDATYKRLFVGDENTGRIIIYDLLSGITNGMAASYVLGQPTLTASPWSTASSSSFLYSESLAYDIENQKLFVGDANSQRILIFDLSGGITNGMAASAVLGKGDFVSAGYETTQDGMGGTYGGVMAYDSATSNLYVSDDYRVLVWKFIQLGETSLASGMINEAYADTASSSYSQGTVSYSIASGSLPTGLSLNSSTGAITGTSTATGTFAFSIKVTDDIGTQGVLTDTHNFSITIGEIVCTELSSTYETVGNTVYLVTGCGVRTVFQTFGSSSGGSSSGGGGSSGGGSGGFSLPPVVLVTIPVSTVTTLPVTPTHPTTPVIAKHIFSKNLIYGQSGIDVRKLQEYLKSLGYFSLTPNGYFGPYTKAQLIKFQKSNKITPASGFFGPLTRKFVNGD